MKEIPVQEVVLRIAEVILLIIGVALLHRHVVIIQKVPVALIVVLYKVIRLLVVILPVVVRVPAAILPVVEVALHVLLVAVGGLREEDRF